MAHVSGEVIAEYEGTYIFLAVHGKAFSILKVDNENELAKGDTILGPFGDVGYHNFYNETKRLQFKATVLLVRQDIDGRSYLTRREEQRHLASNISDARA